MIRLTTKQRNQAYRWAYNELDCFLSLNKYSGICSLLSNWLDNRYGGISRPQEMVGYFDEFKLFEQVNMYWFDNSEERLTCLAFCIAMTE